LERVRQRLLGKGVVNADAENLDVQGLKPAVVGLPGREVRRSDRRKIATSLPDTFSRLL
jgi:hypothetical protein